MQVEELALYETGPAQYTILYNGMAIEDTGYLPTLAAAKKFARDRYGVNGVCIVCAYPPSHRDNIKHSVAY